MAEETVTRVINPLAIVKSWAEKPGTVSHAAVAHIASGAPAQAAYRNTPAENFQMMLSKLPPEQREAAIAQAAARRVEKAAAVADKARLRRQLGLR